MEVGREERVGGVGVGVGVGWRSRKGLKGLKGLGRGKGTEMEQRSMLFNICWLHFTGAVAGAGVAPSPLLTAWLSVVTCPYRRRASLGR